jgi:cell division protein FtsL
MESLGRSVLIQLMLAMSLIALASLMYMAQESSISVQQINLSVLRSEHMQLVADNTKLRTTATALQSTPRVDLIATTQLNMAKRDPGSYMWPIVQAPRLQPVQPVNADTLAAQRESSPLAWMTRAVHAVGASL